MTPAPTSPIDRAKAAAARRAAEMVEDGMRLGLGTGSTAAWFVRALAERVRAEGLRVAGVPTSERTAELARAHGIEVAGLDGGAWLDLCVDGADEVDGELGLIKGGGGALLREKIVAVASERVVIIADAGKRVETLGAFPLPVEVVRFGWPATKALVEEALVGEDVLGRDARLRMAGTDPFVTDEGHLILDLPLGRIGDPRRLAATLGRIPGVVETGLFIDLCDVLLTGHGDGRVELREAGGGSSEGHVAFLDADNIFTDVAG